MREYFIKALKWYSIVLFFILGAGLLFYADRYQDIRPVFPAVLCFGAGVILTVIWKDISGKLVFVSMFLVMALCYIAQVQYVPVWLYVYTGYSLQWPFLLLWAVLTAVIGIPAMTVVIKHYGDRFE